MHGGVFIVGIVFTGIVLALAIISGTILMAIKLRHSGISPKAQQANHKEAEMIQSIYQGLERLEQRVDSLETLLMDHPDRNRN